MDGLSVSQFACSLRFVQATLLGQHGMSHAWRPRLCPCSACCIAGMRCVSLSTAASVLSTRVSHAVGKHGLLHKRV